MKMVICMSNPNDADFIDNLQRLLGVDPKKLELLIPKLNPNVLTDLAGAVSNNDKKEAMALILQGREQKMSEDKLIVKKTKNPERKTLLDMDMNDYFQFNVGDKVKVNGKDATIKLPNGPGNTVGVMIGGKMDMVDRKDVKKVDESVLGLANIPDIKRMQELAGIANSGMDDMNDTGVDANPTVEIQSIDPEEGISFDSDIDMDCCGDNALALLDQIAAMLPNLRLSEVSATRKRINQIMTQMNESINAKPTIRKRKI